MKIPFPTEVIFSAAWEQHQRDGHGYHPEDPHYCWPEHRDEYMEDAEAVLNAAVNKALQILMR